MSKAILLIDDDQYRCTSHLHSTQITVCLNPNCHTLPIITCVDCADELHDHGDGEDLMEKSQFIIETNKLYQKIQDQAYALEGEFQVFEKKGTQMRKQINGDLERLKIQLSRMIDNLKDQLNKQFDEVHSFTKKQINLKVQRVKDAFQYKACSISKIQPSQLRKLLNSVWHTDYELDRTSMKQFYPKLQETLKQNIAEIFEQVCQSLSESSQDLIGSAQNQIQEYKTQQVQNEIGLAGDQIPKLLKERETLKNQMEQHLQSRNCTHKGCHQVKGVKAYYGYYYHVSGYAVLGELPISVCAKSKKLAVRMDEVVNNLYKLQHRDSKVDDCVQAYFIY